MKTTVRIITAAYATLPMAAWAAQTPASKEGGVSWLVIGFLAFFGAMVLFQLVPAIILFGSMLKAMFGKKVEAEKTVAGTEAK